MDLTVHCICTGGIHIFLILHCTYFLRPNSNRSVLCFKISLVWRKKIDVSQKKSFCLKEPKCRYCTNTKLQHGERMWGIFLFIWKIILNTSNWFTSFSQLGFLLLQ